MAQRYEERYFSVDEYLAQEEHSREKHEYFEGRVYLMPGGSPEHAIIMANISGELTIALKGRPCIVYSSEVLLQVEASNFFTYADVTVVCEPPRYAAGRGNRCLVNPGLIVEVLSPSTEGYDRGAKFKLYKGFESLQDYLLVDSHEPYVQHYRKLDPDTWVEKTYSSLEQSISLDNLDIRLALADIYRQVEFDPEPPRLP